MSSVPCNSDWHIVSLHSYLANEWVMYKWALAEVASRVIWQVWKGLETKTNLVLALVATQSPCTEIILLKLISNAHFSYLPKFLTINWNHSWLFGAEVLLKVDEFKHIHRPMVKWFTLCNFLFLSFLHSFACRSDYDFIFLAYYMKI